MNEKWNKIGRSLAYGQTVSLIIAIGNLGWRFVQLIIEAGDWYIMYVLQYLAWSVVLLIVSFIVTAATWGIFVPEGSAHNAPAAFLPGALCAALMGSFVYDFEYVVLLGLFDGIELRTLILCGVVAILYMITIFKTDPEKSEISQ